MMKKLADLTIPPTHKNRCRITKGINVLMSLDNTARRNTEGIASVLHFRRNPSNPSDCLVFQAWMLL